MSIEKLSEAFEYLAEQPLEKLAAAKKKSKKKKLDPKAKVRNRGTVCVPASSAKDKKDHFPINSESQARNALARVHQYSIVPPWYKGSLKGLQALVSRKVHSKYPGIEISKDKKKSKKSELELADTFEKLAINDKFAATKEQVDRYIGKLESLIGTLETFARIVSSNLHFLKKQYTTTFDPELEHMMIEMLPKLTESILSAAKQTQNVRHRIDELVKRVESNSPTPPPGPISAP